MPDNTLCACHWCPIELCEEQAMTDLTKLKELAEWATQSGWTHDADRYVVAQSDQVNDGWGICLCEGPDAKKNRDFIAAANPQAILALLDEIDRLRSRLEIDERTPHDGIACRDETIKALDEKCDRLKAENEALREKLNDCAISLHGEMLQKYGGQMPEDMHPVTRRNYDRDMAEVEEYRAALEGGADDRP